jgi:large subunit ribosomal protein L17
MRHRNHGRKLGRTSAHRKAMLRNMVTTLLDLEKLETTDAKAKEVRSLAEKMVTLGKRGQEDLAARRQALSVIRSKKVVAKLFNEIGPRFADRPGGYTRIIKVDERRGDGAPLSIIQLVDEPVTFKERKPRFAEEPDNVIRPAAPVAGTNQGEPEAGASEMIDAEAGGGDQVDATEPEEKKED